MILARFNSWGYRYVVRPICFMFEAKRVHNIFIDIGVFLGRSRISKFITRKLFSYQNKLLEQDLLGIRFRNPVGLAAGFDKDARMISIMEDVGFGFVEVGSLTRFSCLGNVGQRMKRLVNEKSLWIHLGLNNRGSDAAYLDLKNKRFAIPYGVSAAKTNCKENVDSGTAIEDYIYTLKKFRELAAYFTINISCPNAFGGQPFSNPNLFENLMTQVDKLKLKQPVFVKLSPDLSEDNLDKILKISKEHNVQGFVCTNLTKMNYKSGGCSGKMLQGISDEVIRRVYLKTKNWKRKVLIIGVGGVSNAEDAYRKMRLGANLVQLISGMIYEGPSVIGEINSGLIGLMRRDKFRKISDFVGIDA